MKMNHQAEARITGSATTEGKIGLHASAVLRIVVPVTNGFAAPPQAKPMTVDSSKVSVKKG